MKGKEFYLFASLFASMMDIPNHRKRNSVNVNNIDITPKPKIIPKGCKVFIIDGKEIIALNEKSAIKKAFNQNK